MFARGFMRTERHSQNHPVRNTKTPMCGPLCRRCRNEFGAKSASPNRTAKFGSQLRRTSRRRIGFQRRSAGPDHSEGEMGPVHCRTVLKPWHLRAGTSAILRSSFYYLLFRALAALQSFLVSQSTKCEHRIVRRIHP